jgi:uncharacterized damage-inducible protein DinB
MSKLRALIFCSAILFTTSITIAEQPIFVQEFLGQVDFIKGRLMQLAEAMPEDKYSWKPGEEVRSVGEVYVHSAEANHYFLSIMNGTKPDMSESSKETDKKTALAMLEKSFDVVKETAGNFTEEDLNKEVEAFGMKFSVRNFMITLLNHNHEHLGQSIAYARMNGVTPPWSNSEN